ncbi:MAG TPA: DUF1080 domain-containing protein [Prolixibacteraceae bacterium]|nr:DUF1080 domain-containing protein [Prolixibacteraceae bacterium]
MKKKNYPSVLLIAILTFMVSCQTGEPWQPVFNGEDLSGWETWVGPLEENGEPVGLNKDPKQVFSVTEVDGEKTIRISGEVNASLATIQEYENYHLVMEFKWGEQVYSKRNSGLLYHSFGEYGEGLGVWMSGHELQLWTGNIGDSYRMGKSYCEIPMKQTSEGKYIYAKDAEMAPSIPDTETRIVSKNGDNENAIGEWNTVEIYCYGGTSVHMVNGNVNMVNYNSGKYFGEDNIEPLTKGKIQIQSEGGELFIRTLKIQPIKEIPEDILPQPEE